ncbi:MAG: SMC family ATPase [Methanomicrobiales archaeon]|nr:SMC family ATPase [Methanomicrobiales archaeon]
MQLDRLQMRNFKRFRNQDVIFRDGITGILGNNGTGKSTIVDAILFCLYGVKETGLDYIISATAGQRDKAEVRLDFSVRGEEFQVIRSLDHKKKHEVEIHKAKKLFARGVSDVHDALRKVVHMGHADFRHTIFSGQKELLTLVDAKPEERKRWFRRVLGLDRLKEEGGEILRTEAGAARDQCLLLKGRLEDVHPEVIQADLEDLGRRIATTEEMIRSLEEGLKEIEVRRRSLEGETCRLRELEREDLSIRTRIRSRQEEAEKIQEELARIKRDIELLGEHRQEFQSLAAEEPGFEELREQLAASKERRFGFQALQERDARVRTRMGEEAETLTSLQKEDTELGLDEERIKALGAAVSRRTEALARLVEIGRREEQYRNLVAGIAKKDEALSGAAKSGAELRSRLEKIQEARARLIGMTEPYRARVPSTDDPLTILETLHQELLGLVAGSSATRDQASRVRAKLEGDLATMEARGVKGDCPLCRQPLGIRYREIVGDLKREIQIQTDTIAHEEETLLRAGDERTAIESTLAEARRLQEVASRMSEVTAEWKEVQERSRREIAEKERLEQEMISLAYDPEERQRLDREIASLEGSWEEHVALSERVKRRPALAERIRETEEKLEGLKRDLDAIARDTKEIGFDPEDHLRLEREIGIAEGHHRRFIELKPGMDRLPLLEGRTSSLMGMAEEVRRALVEMEATRKEIPFSRDRLNRHEQDLQSVQQEVLTAAQEVSKFRSDLLHLKEEMRRQADALVKFERDRRELDRLSGEIRILELTRDQLNGFTDHLLGVVRDQIQDETGRILSEITDGRYDTVILDDNFELLVHDLGGDYPVSRFSGGEQDDIAIALRIALSRYIAETHELHDSTFLIFDEIFGSQDEERRGNIFRALRTLEPYFPQIFLISHVSEVQGEFRNTLIVEAVSESESRIRDLEGAPA